MISLSLPSPAKLPPPSFRTVSPSRQKSSSARIWKHPNFEPLKDRLIRLANAGQLHQVISVLDPMSEQGLAPDLVTYSVLLKSCIRTRQFNVGKRVHRTILSESSLELDSVVLNSLISLYSKSGDWGTTNSIFQSMGERRDLVSWSATISCFAHKGMESKAISTFIDMIEFGEYPNRFCFAAVIQACSSPENAWVGEIISRFVIKTEFFESDVCVGCALIYLFARGAGDLGSAKNMFGKMPERNSVRWTLMINRYS